MYLGLWLHVSSIRDEVTSLRSELASFQTYAESVGHDFDKYLTLMLDR